MKLRKGQNETYVMSNGYTKFILSLSKNLQLFYGGEIKEMKGDGTTESKKVDGAIEIPKGTAVVFHDESFFTMRCPKEDAYYMVVTTGEKVGSEIRIPSKYDRKIFGV